MRWFGLLPAAGMLAAVGFSGAAIAQEGAAPAQPAPRYLADSASPFGQVSIAGSKVTMPELAFDEASVDPASYEKYYYFFRADTDLETAFADISECDGYARGLRSGIGYTATPYPYAASLAGAAGGLLGNLMAQAIFGSAEKRRMRRVNMRNCMHFKGYGRYGLAKERWEKFNFEEGLTGVSDADRERFLQQQALVASSAHPGAKELGL